MLLVPLGRTSDIVIVKIIEENKSLGVSLPTEVIDQIKSESQGKDMPKSRLVLRIMQAYFNEESQND